MEDELELKVAFAEAWLRQPDNAFAAALSIVCNDPGKALYIAERYTNDPEVLAFKQQLVAEYGEEHFLPSKASMLHDILSRARGCSHDDDYVKLMKLAADMRGMIEKPGVTVNNNSNVTINKVMLIPKSRTDDEWEQGLLENQKNLTLQ